MQKLYNGLVVGGQSVPLRSSLNIGYSYHIYNLLQCQSKCEVDGVSVIEDWSLKTIVVFQQVVQQPPFIASTVST